MMNKNRLPHVITIAALVVFVVLGLACESTPSSYSSGRGSSSSSSGASGSSSGCSAGYTCSLVTGPNLGIGMGAEAIGSACYSSSCTVRQKNGRTDLPEYTTYRCDC